MIRPRKRTQRIGWDAQPTDAEADADELRMTAAVAAPYDHDTPDVHELMQAETGQPDEPIPVRLTNPVQVNQLPTRLARMFSRAVGTVPEKVLNDDPRRASIRMIASGANVAFGLGRSQAECADDDCFRLALNSGPYVFHFTDEVWARRIGGAATDRLCITVEQWAR